MQFNTDQADAYIQKKYPDIYSLLVVRSGRLVAERYHRGHTSESLMEVRSVTKSFTSALIGIALKEKHIHSLELTLADFFPDLLPSQAEPSVRETTLRHLLMMTSGFYWKTGTKLGEPLVHRLHQSRHWIRFILRLPVIPEMRGRFQYRSADSHLLSAILTRATGKNALEYAHETLFGPLGISAAEWPADAQGNSAGHVFLKLRARDMAKLGMLYLSRGRWNGLQILPEEWIDQSTSPQSEGVPALGKYGFHWWITTLNGKSAYYALGHGGQFIYVFPELDMVVVMTANPYVKRWKNPVSVLERFILPLSAEKQ